MKVLVSVLLVMLLGGGAALVHWAPTIAVGALLHPVRTPIARQRPGVCVDRVYQSDISLAGWACAAAGPRRGTIVYLHGIGDNRASGTGVIQRYTAQGFDVVAFDGRAHGKSGGDSCSYGVREKEDLRRVIDTLPSGPVILVGTSLGAAVAIQAAAEDARISGVVAAEVFSSLETVARERAPAFLPEWLIRDVFDEAESQARFRIADANPEAAARRVRVPVLLLHGALDVDTPPAHSQRVHDALGGPKQLILVPGAKHNESLSREETWEEVDRWVKSVISRTTNNEPRQASEASGQSPLEPLN